MWRRMNPHDVGGGLTSLTIFLLYVRQMCVVQFAILTNVLPIARDLCTFRRWLNGEAHFFAAAAAIFRFCAHQFLVLDPSELILHKGQDQLGEGEDFCTVSETDPHYIDVATEPKYKRMMFSDMVSVFQTYPASSYGITITLFLVIVFPQVIHTGFQKLYRSSASKTGYSSLRHLHSNRSTDNEWDSKPLDKLEQDLAILKMLQKRLNPTEVNKSIDLCSKAMRKKQAAFGPLSTCMPATASANSVSGLLESLVPGYCSQQSMSLATPTSIAATPRPP